MKIKRMDKESIEQTYKRSLIFGLFYFGLFTLIAIATFMALKPIHTLFWIGVNLAFFILIISLFWFNDCNHAKTQMQLLSMEDDLKCLIGKKQK